MSAKPVVGDELFCIGAVCRSRSAIIRSDDDDASRLCEIIGVVPQEWWRRVDVPEYKVRMLAFPVTTIRRATELQMVS